MTVSVEPRPPRDAVDGPLGSAWRARSEAAQEAVLPSGRVVVSCSAPFGTGGLGRHTREIADALDRGGRPGTCVCPRRPPGEARCSFHEIGSGALAGAVGRLLRPSPPWRTWSAGVAFDARAARALPQGEHLIAFNGQALAQLAAARRAGWASVSLMAANSHLRRVVRQHARAYERYPLERSWAQRLVERNVREYARADRIYVASGYTRESFLEEGFPEESLALFPLTPDPRYVPEPRASRPGTFDVVYVGSLTVAKGVPLLLEAFGRLDRPDMRLVLVGGWGTRGMRRFIERECAADSRIGVQPGDPLPHLRAASLCVHPAYEDGFAYAPAEALACGVPVIVSEDTGMKELIDPGRNGLIVPTGDPSKLAEAIDAAYAREILSG